MINEDVFSLGERLNDPTVGHGLNLPIQRSWAHLLLILSASHLIFIMKTWQTYQNHHLSHDLSKTSSLTRVRAAFFPAFRPLYTPVLRVWFSFSFSIYVIHAFLYLYIWFESVYLCKAWVFWPWNIGSALAKNRRRWLYQLVSVSRSNYPVSFYVIIDRLSVDWCLFW